MYILFADTLLYENNTIPRPLYQILDVSVPEGLALQYSHTDDEVEVRGTVLFFSVFVMLFYPLPLRTQTKVSRNSFEKKKNGDRRRLRENEH